LSIDLVSAAWQSSRRSVSRLQRHLDAQVARGTLSDRPYPPEVLSAYDSAPAAPIVDEPAGSFISRSLAEATNPLLIVLKPPLELLALLAEDEQQQGAGVGVGAGAGVPALLRKATCAVYGSFNFRRVLEIFPQDGEAQLQRLMGSFRVSVVAERGPAVGSAGILDATNTNFEAFDESFREVMLAWNAIAARNLSNSVAEDAAALVVACADSDYAAMSKLTVRIARRAGVCRCIGDAKGAQIAAADPIVAALLLSPEAFEPYLKPMSFVINEHDALIWTGEEEEAVAGAEAEAEAEGGGRIYCLTAAKGEEQAKVLALVCSAVESHCSL
jgi:hypothetical protein